MEDESPVIGARGPRHLESLLIRDIGAAITNQVRPLSSSVLVVVPSATLRRHLQVQIARSLGPAVLGVQVQLIGHLARDVLRRTGVPDPEGGVLFEVLARRAAAKSTVLQGPLDGLEDGYGVAAQAIRDLLSAGLNEDNAAELHRRLPPSAVVARAVVSAATETHKEMKRLGIGRRADGMALAARRVAQGDLGATPGRKVFIYGFADAPGMTTRFISALIRHAGARLYVDRPVDPVDPATEDLGCRFADRFIQRCGIEHGACPEAPTGATVDTSHSAFTASGAEAEVREVAHRVRKLLESGVTPEDVAIVTRNLEMYAAPLRKRLDELAIPFTGGAVPAAWHPAQRRQDAVFAVLRDGPDVMLDHWFNARGRDPSRADGMLACRVLGWTRLADLIDPEAGRTLDDRNGVVLPVRGGFQRSASKGEVTNRPRRFAQAELTDLIRDADATSQALRGWPDHAPLHAHIDNARAFSAALDLERSTGSDPDPVGRRWASALKELEELPAGLELSADEFRGLMESSTAQGWAQMGGRGAGVQVLDVTHARGLTSSHLFLLGLERDVFPRAAAEDPLLPDVHRSKLRAALPDLACQSFSRDEERYLFASLMGASSKITLSWRRADEEGRGRAPSPFMERLRLAGRIDISKVGRSLHQVLATNPGTAWEAMLAAGLSGRRDVARELCPSVITEVWTRGGASETSLPHLPAPDRSRLAEVRGLVLQAVDPDRSTAEGRAVATTPSPWFGALGPIRPETADPRRRDLYVTSVENMARCPWQAFLTRDLGLKRLPDPVAGPPTLSSLLLGNIVHGGLEHLIRGALDPSGETANGSMEGDGTDVPLPHPDAVRASVRHAVDACCDDEGLHLSGLRQVLLEVCLPMVQRALDTDWRDGDRVHVLGVELNGTSTVTLGDREATLRFKVDRVDRRADGTLLLTDYKTGKPISTAKREQTRARHVSRSVLRGTHLQAGAYATSRPGAQGRYLFLTEGLDDEHRSFTIESDSSEARSYETTAAALILARDDGVMFPRLGDGKGERGKACEFCEVVEACVQNDSGMKRRIESLAHRSQQALESGSAASPFERHLARLWIMDEGTTS